MLHHQFHFLVNFGRQLVHLYQHASRIIEVGLLRLQGSPRNAKSSGERARMTPHSRKSPLLIHYHIFKNAGTSFEWTLEEIFGKRFQRYDSQAPGGVLSGDDIARFVADAPEAQVLSSHQATLPAPHIRGRAVFSSILIRDPIARIRSIYAFERRQEAATPGALKAKELDFREYVDWRLSATPTMLCNYQVHFCARTRKTPGRAVIGEIELQKAIENLDRIDIVGTVERYDEWLALAQSILSKSFPHITLSTTRQNVSVPSRVSTEATILDDLIRDLGHSMAQRLLKCNELDMCLHQVADALLTRRLGERGIKITLREAYASVQQDPTLNSQAESTEGE